MTPWSESPPVLLNDQVRYFGRQSVKFREGFVPFGLDSVVFSIKDEQPLIPRINLLQASSAFFRLRLYFPQAREGKLHRIKRLDNGFPGD